MTDASWYREVAPPPSLADLVVSFWEIRIAALVEPVRMRILPNAAVDLVLYASETSQGEGLGAIVAPPHRSWLVGSTLRSFMVRSTGWRHVLGVSLRPEGVAPILGVPASVIGEGVALLDDLIGADAGRLEEEVLDGRSGLPLTRLVGAIERRRQTRVISDPLVHHAAQLVRRGRGRQRIDAITGAVNLSPRQLERRFLAEVGMSPKLYSRLIRFDRVVRDIGRRGPLPWAEFALAHGYADQAHFINEFREFAGVTPVEFERETHRVDTDVLSP